MMVSSARTVFSAVALALAAAIAAPAASAQDMLASARALYTSAEYESALATLNQMRANGLVTEDVPTVEQYRALCLLALGRSSEAEAAMAAAVAAVPSFSPSGSDVSPRVKSTFAEVRRRVLPTIVQQKYSEAKSAFDRRDFVTAGDGFTEVLRVLDDPDLATIASQPPLADMRTLARGFKDLSANAALTISAPSSAPAPLRAAVAPAPAVATAAPPATAPASSTRAPAPTLSTLAPAAAAPRIYTVADAQVVAPTIVRQVLPPFPRKPMFAAQGVVEVVINETGTVESSVIRASIDPTYDRIALEASQNWRYKPATREGVPVKFRKLVQVKIQP
jgi:TonB family protein